jgi:hypothetical protein
MKGELGGGSTPQIEANGSAAAKAAEEPQDG